MAFPTDMVYIRYEFSWVSPSTEIQDTGLWARLQTVAGNPLDWDTATASIAATAVSAWAENWGQPAFSDDLTAMRVVCYHYDQPLKNVLNRGEAAFAGPTAWGGTAGGNLPPECTMALGLYGYDPATFVPNRARKRGRMYLPTLAPNQIAGGGWMGTGAQQSWLDQSVNWFNALTEDLAYPLNAQLVPGVVSRGGKDGTQASAFTPVTHLRMGRVVDTQRRRRNALDEQYIAAPVG